MTKDYARWLIRQDKDYLPAFAKAQLAEAIKLIFPKNV